MNPEERSIIGELTGILQGTGKNEKHRFYHLLPDRLNRLIDNEEEQPTFVFFERERLAYIKSKVNVSGHRVLDIGCNTGFILFDLLDSGAQSVTGYEGKELCSRYLHRAIELLGEKERFAFHHQYFDFSNSDEQFDTIILLNVLHHVGDDYGEKSLNIEKAKEKILEQLNGLSKRTRNLVFQLGFNWQGNIHQCLFENGTKSEMIDYIRKGTSGDWDITGIGIAERNDGVTKYCELNETNIERDDSLGEFLNRPIFILKSKHQ
ncbi:MAG: class I SAM-dependent methyltransferase [Bacteroidota bacterium]